jgi:hypothetical protein
MTFDAAARHRLFVVPLFAESNTAMNQFARTATCDFKVVSLASETGILRCVRRLQVRYIQRVDNQTFPDMAGSVVSRRAWLELPARLA